jgi:hypothetical protein
MAQFIDDIKLRARGDFNLNDDEDIEIIIAGQYHNVNGRDPELAPAIQPSNMLLSDFYRNIHMNTSFYIRKISNNYTINFPLDNDIENNINISVPRITQQYVGYENV